MGFLTIFYKYIIQQHFIVQIFLPHPSDRTSGAPSFIRHPFPYMCDAIGVFYNRNSSNLDSSDQQIRLCCGLNLNPDS